MSVPLTLWTMTKDTRTLRCGIERHALGRELRLYLDGELLKSQVVRSDDDLIYQSNVWQAAAGDRGWTAVHSEKRFDPSSGRPFDWEKDFLGRG